MVYYFYCCMCVRMKIEDCYSQFRVRRVGEFGLNPCSLSQSLIFLLGTLVLLETFNRGMH